MIGSGQDTTLVRSNWIMKLQKGRSSNIVHYVTTVTGYFRNPQYWLIVDFFHHLFPASQKTKSQFKASNLFYTTLTIIHFLVYEPHFFRVSLCHHPKGTIFRQKSAPGAGCFTRLSGAINVSFLLAIPTFGLNGWSQGWKILKILAVTFSTFLQSLSNFEGYCDVQRS